MKNVILNRKTCQCGDLARMERMKKIGRCEMGGVKNE